MTVDQIDFKPHPIIPEAVQGHVTLTNGITVSVVGGPGMYGDGRETFEVAAWRGERESWITLGEHDDVVGWQTVEQVNEIITRLSGDKT